jgi:SAM-dependent methyltransferase
MITIAEEQDAFGRALLDYLASRAVQNLILEADDGSWRPAMEPAWFFQTSEAWYAWERNALDLLEGPVLDLGCGAGRAALYLQEKGIEVTAVDTSPGAVSVCQARGVRDIRLGDLRMPPGDKRWHGILMLCGNLGLTGGWHETRALLTTLAKLAAPDALLVADTVDPTVSAEPDEIEDQRKRQEQGRYVGQVRLRLRYGQMVSPWWNQVNITIQDMPRLVEGTGWTIQEHHLNGEDHYVMLRRTVKGR